MSELLLPRTDAGVLVQVVVALVLLVTALVVVTTIADRHRREWLQFVSGLGMLTAGAFGLRMLH
jgi:hypothetical protein